VADILTQVLGRKITYVPVEIEAFSEIWKEMRYSPYIRQHISAVAQDCRDGVFSGTNDLVEKLTGQKPMQMLYYIVKNKALFCYPARKTPNKPKHRCSDLRIRKSTAMRAVGSTGGH
jgi:NAD(P)H dehydrogenase (quinone)